jgi:hypothetical protein
MPGRCDRTCWSKGPCGNANGQRAFVRCAQRCQQSVAVRALLSSPTGKGLAVGIQKPVHVNTAKPKRLHPAPDVGMLSSAASTAVYGASRYHCRGPKGEPVIIKVKPSTPCPRQWSDQDATRALRDAIRNGVVCEIWEDGFPRHVWHRDGDVLYEARHTRGPSGLFHAYPIESLQAPIGLAL